MIEEKTGQDFKIWPWIRDIGIAILIAVIVLQFFRPTVVKEHSMEPTLDEDNYVIMSKQSYILFGALKNGDIVIFKSQELDEKGNYKNLIKRAIAIPGDTIRIEGGEVYLNGTKIAEPYISQPDPSKDMQEILIPEGMFFALGDNRPKSLDSRELGLIPIENIMGKAVFRLMPFDRFGSLSTKEVEVKNYSASTSREKSHT